MTVLRAHDLVITGQNPGSLVRQGKLVRVRHGAYADAVGTDALTKHRQLVAGTWPIVGADAVLSHISAGVMHGLPTWDDSLDRVTVARPSGGHGSRRTSLHVRVSALPRSDTTSIEGRRVTSIERTVADLACMLRYERAVAVMDAALHAGADRSLIADQVSASARKHGIRTARAALEFADGRSESVAESMSRVRMSEVGVPEPELQVEIFDDFGNLLGRSDFGWVLLGVLGEFDGKVKYIGPSDQVARTVMNEKSREDSLRQLGWVVVRWNWQDLLNPSALRRRIEAAFEQANPEKIRGHYRLTPAI